KVRIELVDSGAICLLSDEGNGYFRGVHRGIGSGTRYSIRLDDDESNYPDPASRFQPEGVHGASQVIDPAAYDWKDAGWTGVELPGQVIYELHIGCFTPEGTWRAAEEHLSHLKETGITMLEVMP